MRFVFATSVFILLFTLSLQAADPQPTGKILYKQVGDVKLHLHAFEPQGHTADDERAAIVFFFGGGWNGGTPTQFYRQSAHLAQRGMVAYCAEYRVRSRNGTTPFDCVTDGKSAVRYIRQHAGDLGVNPFQIAAGGGSAGGHVAACTGVIDEFDEENEELQISSKPSALVLFNPVIDTGPKGYGYDRLKERYKEISPVEHVTKATPPTILFQGDADTTTPVSGARTFAERMKKLDRRCELVEFPGAKHGFFNRGEAFEKTLAATDRFLTSLGYLPKP
mgnify:CR=1 FL=1